MAMTPVSRHGLPTGAGWVVLLLVWSGLAGCGDNGSGSVAAERRSEPSSCELTHRPGRTTETVEVAGVARRFELFVPTGYDGTTPVPMVLDLHGSTVTADAELTMTRMTETAEREGFVVVAPEAIDRLWNIPGVPTVTGGTLPPTAPSDIVFLDEVIGHVASVVCIDPSRVFATGFSGGGRLLSQAGCDLSERLAGIAPVAGLRHPPGCAPRRPLPVITFHGTADPLNPFAGGAGARWDYGVEEATRRWAVTNGCQPEPQRETISSSVERRSFLGCRHGVPVELYVVAGGGHTWPSGGPLPAEFANRLGPTNTEVNATDVIWEFFRTIGA